MANPFVLRSQITVHEVTMEYAGIKYLVRNDVTKEYLSSGFNTSWDAEAWRQRYFENNPQIKEN